MKQTRLRKFILSFLRKTTGWPPAPMTNAQKHEVMRSYAHRHPKAAFVESGTLRGDTVAAMRPHFDQLISIELFDELFFAAKKRFEADDGIAIIKGDSGKLLPEILRDISIPTVYWLDGHFSGEGTALASDTQCPILAELEAIAEHGNRDDVILIDDARLFGWRLGYPKKSTLSSLVKSRFPHHKMQILQDIIAILPQFQ